MLEALLEWATALPDAALYALLFVSAAIENVLPPFPSDVVIAFGGFLLAQGARGTLFGTFLAVWLGNVSTAMLLYVLGRRYGAERVERRIGGKHAQDRDARIRKLFARFGLPAVFLSRFVPGVRALVPAVAGALRMPAGWVTFMVASASGLWYGMIVIVAFRVGADWERLREMVTSYGRLAAVMGGGLLIIGAAAWLIARKRSS